jgi:hypothetical protein
VGGGLLGSIFGGVLLGGGAEALIEGAAHSIEHFFEKIKEMTPAVSTLQQLNEQFDKLTKIRGIDGTKFLDDLKTSTHGLVDEINLYRMANTFMQSNLKVSEQDVAKLTQAVVGLARAQGRDATQAVNAMNRAFLTGRFQLLAMVTGIQRSELQVRGLGSAMDTTTRNMLTFQRMSQVIEDRFRRFGEPALTLQDVIKKAAVALDDFINRAALSTTKTSGFHSFIATVVTLVNRFSESTDNLAEKIGRSLGPVFTTMEALVKSFVELGKAAIDTAKQISKSVDDIISSFAKMSGGGDGLVKFMQNLISIRGTMLGIAMIAKELSGYIEQWQIASKWNDKIRTARKKGATDEDLSDMQDAMVSEIQLAKEKLDKDQKKIVDQLMGRDVSQSAIPFGASGTGGLSAGLQDDQQKEKIKLAQLDIQINAQKNKQILDDRKELNKQLQQLLDDQLKNGEITLQEHVAQTKVNNEELLEIERTTAESQLSEKKSLYKAELDAHRLTKAEYTKQIQLATIEEENQEKSATNRYLDETRKADEKLVQDRLAAKKVALQSEVDQQQAANQEMQQLNEELFKNGERNVGTYLGMKKKLYAEEAAVEEQKALAEFDASDKGERAKTEMLLAFQKANEKAQKEITKTELEESRIRMEAADKEYEKKAAALQQQLAFVQSFGKGKGSAYLPPGMSEVSAIGDLKSAVSDQMQRKQDEMDSMQLQFGNKAFLMQPYLAALEALTKLRNEQQKLNEDLAHAKDYASSFAAAVGGIGRLVHSQKLANLSSGESVMQTAMSRSARGDGGSVSGDFFGSLKNLSLHGGKAAEGLKKFGDALTNGIQVFGGFIQTVGSSSSGVGGAISGGLAGAGMGMDVGKMLSKFSSAAGPIGMVAGAAFGSVLSGIVGNKMAQAQQYITDMKKKFDGVVQGIKDGTISMNQGIQQLQSLRADVAAQMGHSKKKARSAFQSELDAMDQQIQALQAQQRKMMEDLATQVSILQAPTDLQSALGDLDSLIKKYQEFAGAASNAMELAQANEYLSLSIKNLADTTQKDLDSAEQTAIEDAIKLNDLYDQRNQLLADYASQEYDIMTRGVLVYQRTLAQSKMQELQQAQKNRDQQLDKLNQEIALTKYKVDAENKVFTLATTRMTLEAQLLKLQDAAIDKDMIRIKALQQVVAALNASGGSITSIQQALALLGLGAASGLPTAPPNPVGDFRSAAFNELMYQGRQGFGDTQSDYVG